MDERKQLQNHQRNHIAANGLGSTRNFKQTLLLKFQPHEHTLPNSRLLDYNRVYSYDNACCLTLSALQKEVQAKAV